MARNPESEPLSRFDAALRRFSAARVGVVGDFMADVYVMGVPARLSREAPVVVLHWESEHTGPGGAANSAANLVALGARVSCVGVAGDDTAGRALRRLFAAGGADVGALRLARGGRTTTKTRILAGDLHRSKQQVIRVDREPDGDPTPAAERHVLSSVRALAGKVDAWLVSDYGYGTVTPRIYDALREGDGKRAPLVVVDSRRRLREFRGATALTPNEDEAGTAAGLTVATVPDAREAARRILEATGAGMVLLTRGNQGLGLFDGDGTECIVPASGADKGEITDNNGAGDTVAATFTLALAAGATPEVAARLANHAGGVVVMKPGAATLTTDELRRRYRDEARRRRAGSAR
jgi:rfaE bifunctional protein kinase chain/domain